MHKSIGIPIEITVTPENEDTMRYIIKNMITNFDEWGEGKEPLIYNIGGHLTSQLKLTIK